MDLIFRMKDLSTHPEIAGNVSPSRTTIRDLPEDCIIKIFSFLDVPERLRAEQVFKRWRKISRRGWSDMKTLCLKDKFNNCTIKDGTKLLRRSGRFLTSLRIPVVYEKLVYMRVAEKYCPRIKKLELVFDYWSYLPVLECYSKHLVTLFRALQQLNWIVMEDINKEVGNKQLRALPEALQKLEMFGSVGHLARFSADLSRFQNLRLLSLSYFTIRGESFQSFEELKQLRELNLSFSRLSTDSIERIPNFKQLERLELRQSQMGGLNPWKIQDHHICDIVDGCPKLKDLKLDGLEALTDSSFRAVSTLRHLETLHMENLPRVTNRSLVGMRQVQNLNCSYCSGIDNQGLRQLIENSQQLMLLKARGTGELSTLLQDVTQAIQNRPKTSTLMIDIGGKEKTLERPENFPNSVVFI